jgi:hypothetical protein
MGDSGFDSIELRQQTWKSDARFIGDRVRIPTNIKDQKFFLYSRDVGIPETEGDSENRSVRQSQRIELTQSRLPDGSKNLVFFGDISCEADGSLVMNPQEGKPGVEFSISRNNIMVYPINENTRARGSESHRFKPGDSIMIMNGLASMAVMLDYKEEGDKKYFEIKQNNYCDVTDHGEHYKYDQDRGRFVVPEKRNETLDRLVGLKDFWRPFHEVVAFAASEIEVDGEKMGVRFATQIHQSRETGYVRSLAITLQGKQNEQYIFSFDLDYKGDWTLGSTPGGFKVDVAPGFDKLAAAMDAVDSVMKQKSGLK